jgi:hypothetical protein
VRSTGPSTYERTQGPLSALRVSEQAPRPRRSAQAVEALVSCSARPNAQPTKNAPGPSGVTWGKTRPILGYSPSRTARPRRLTSGYAFSQDPPSVRRAGCPAFAPPSVRRAGCPAFAPLYVGAAGPATRGRSRSCRQHTGRTAAGCGAAVGRLQEALAGAAAAGGVQPAAPGPGDQPAEPLAQLGARQGHRRADQCPRVLPWF